MDVGAFSIFIKPSFLRAGSGNESAIQNLRTCNENFHNLT
jgi:hypothetical protein